MAAQGFEGRGFLLIGASSGIGLATAEKLIALGAHVVLHGLNETESARALTEKSSRAHFIASDLSNSIDMKALVEEASEKLSRIDGVLFAAGTKSHLPWEEISSQEWDRVLTVNTKSFLLIAQAAVPHLRKTQGSMVAISSTNGEHVNINNVVYDISKAALNHLIRALALELRAEKIRVNGIAPGGVDTPLLRDWLVDYSGSAEAASQVFDSSKASGLLAEPSDIADVITFLFSTEARWVNGAVITADFGASLG